MLIKFLTNSYRSLVGIAAWGFLIIAFAVGLFIGFYVNRFFTEQGLIHLDFFIPLLSAMLSTFLALIVETIMIPPFMVLFTIDARVKYIEEKLKEKQMVD